MTLRFNDRRGSDVRYSAPAAKFGRVAWAVDALCEQCRAVTAFCQHESVSPASFYRWRSLLGTAAEAGHVPVASALPLAKSGFVDLG